MGASVGTTTTRSQFLDNGLQIAGSVEGFVTPRISVRGQAGTAWWDIVGLSYAGTLQPVFVLGNVVYNWAGDDWRPYATGGIGLYRYGFTEAAVSGSKTKTGFDFGGGVDYVLSPETAIAAEGIYNKVGLVPTNRAVLGFRGSFWSFSVGVKQRF